MRTFKLAILATFLYPGGEVFSLQSLVKGLSLCGHQVTLIAFVPNAFPSLRNFFPYAHRIIFLKSASRLERVIRRLSKEPPDAFLISGALHDFPLLALRFQKPLFIRTILHPRWWYSSEGKMTDQTENELRKINLFSDRIITLSHGLRSWLIKVGLRNVSTVHEGCDTDDLRPLARERIQFRKEFSLGKDELVLGILANFTYQKKPEVVIEALAQLPRKPRVKTFLFGGAFRPEMRRYLEKTKALVRQFRLDGRVVFAGFRSDRLRIINGIDVALFPFLDDGFGNALIETMACEKPVIVNHSGVFPEVVRHGREGLLVAPENPSQLAKAVLELVQDPKRRSNLGKQGRARVKEKFSLARRSTAYESLIHQSIKWGN